MFVRQAQDSLLQQKGEENKQLKQDLQRTQHLFTSAERELRYEREKNLDLKRHIALLDQEKVKVKKKMQKYKKMYALDKIALDKMIFKTLYKLKCNLFSLNFSEHLNLMLW